jgi:ferredoxin
MSQSNLSYSAMYLLENSKNQDKQQLLEIQKNIEETILDYSKENSYELAGKKIVAVIYEDWCGFADELDDSFEPFFVPSVSLINVEGRVGAYRLTVNENGEAKTKHASFLVYLGSQNPLLNFDALHSSGGLLEVSKKLQNRAKKDFITKTLLFNEELCDYAKKDTPACRACIDSCESEALVEDRVKKTIKLSFADCVSCGKCIGACPSGAMQNSQFNLEGIVAALEEAKSYGILISTEADLMKLDGGVFENTVIFKVENYSFLNELYLALFAFKSGGEVYFVSEELLPSEVTLSIENTNAIFAAFGKKALYFASSKEKAEKSFSPITKRFENLSLRQAVSEGFKTLSTLEESKIAVSGKMFSSLTVSESCTVCMGCAFVCKSGAFNANEEQKALTLNESLCTGCGHCEAVCPEKSITIETGIFRTDEPYFSFVVAAKDELFCCVECGKPFATQKQIAKVSSVFSTMFLDESKKRTLYCCADCKPKLMLQNFVNSKGVSVGH